MNDKETLEYQYLDVVREDILAMVPEHGKIIGSIGCGYAKTEQQLIKQNREVHGVDVSQAAIDVAQGRLTSAKRIEPDNSLPFDVESLDGLILADVIEHLPMAWKYLNAYATMLKPGGWIVISVPNMRYLPVLNTLVFKGDWPELPLGVFDETHIQVMTHRRLMRWCTNAGLYLDKWHDCYDSRFLVRNMYRALNLASFTLLRSFVVFGIKGVFIRKD